MEMTMNLTFEEGMKVVEAMKEVAIKNGWDAEELDDCGIIDEYSCVVDAALAAMGISVNINATPSYEDEDEDEYFDEDDFNDEDEEEDMESIIYDCDGHRGISVDDARLLMRCVAKVMQKQFSFLPSEAVEILIRYETLRIGEEWGIEVIDTGDE